MKEYIEREAAIVPSFRYLLPNGEKSPPVVFVKTLLHSIPAADVVEVRHGRWVWDGGVDMHYYCSLCHHNAYGNTGEIIDGKYKYCPKCGARMDRGADDAAD